MSTLSQVLESLNECVDVNTNAFTAFEHSSEPACYLVDLLELTKSKKPILMHHPDASAEIEVVEITDAMLESEEDVYPQITPLLALNKCNYKVQGYLAVKSITEYENFILISHATSSNFTDEEVTLLNAAILENSQGLNLKAIKKEFKRKIAYNKDCDVSAVTGKMLKKYIKKLSDKILVTDALGESAPVSLLSTKNVIRLYHTNEFIELLFVDDSFKNDVFCVTRFDQ